jgi:hypothetical protein
VVVAETIGGNTSTPMWWSQYWLCYDTKQSSIVKGRFT